MQYTKRQERRHDESGARWHLSVLVEVAEIQDRIWDEPTFYETKQGARGAKGLLASNEALADADDTLVYHLNRDPYVGSKLLRDHLRRYLCKEETEI